VQLKQTLIPQPLLLSWEKGNQKVFLATKTTAIQTKPATDLVGVGAVLTARNVSLLVVCQDCFEGLKTLKTPEKWFL